MNNLGVYIGFGLAAVVVGVIVTASFKIADDSKRQWINLTFVVLGALAGWVAGVLVTPLTEGEAGRFSELGLGFTALGSGVVATKVIEALQKKFDQGLDAAFVGSAGLFLVSLLLGGLSTFVWRTYISSPEQPARKIVAQINEERVEFKCLEGCLWTLDAVTCKDIDQCRWTLPNTLDALCDQRPRKASSV